MDRNRLPGILAPIFIGAAIIASWRLEPARRPIELEAATEVRSVAELQSAFAAAAAPSSPGFELGPSDAPVTVLEFADFGCRYCGSFARETFPALLTEYVNAGKVRWKYVPFVMGMFPHGKEAAVAATCAARQGEENFWRMHDLLYAQQPEWQGADDAAALFRNYAGQIALDVTQFDRCWSGEDAAQVVARAGHAAEQLGVRATPTFFIDGRRIEGALPIPEFRTVLNEALSAAR